MKDAETGGGFIETALPGGGGGFIETALPEPPTRGGFIETALPVRKRLNHRGPITIDVTRAWYFITICAKERVDYGRAVSMKPPPTPFMEHVPEILDAARFRHIRGDWKLALFLVMPDHIHLIANFPEPADPTTHPARATMATMERVIREFKRWLSTRAGLEFQRDYWETRIRDDARFGEAFSYICMNPVRKNLCATARNWPYVMAFERDSGNERQHRGLKSKEDGGME